MGKGWSIGLGQSIPMAVGGAGDRTIQLLEGDLLKHSKGNKLQKQAT